MERHRERPAKRIQVEIFRYQIALVVIMAAIITVAGVLLSLRGESVRLDQNLQNVAEAIAHAQVVQEAVTSGDGAQSDSVLRVYLDSLRQSLSNIDVISVVRADNVRCYHSNAGLIGTVYDGTLPEFVRGEKEFYASSDTGPSGSQRRAYAAIYGAQGEYIGFVMAVMLRQNILRTTLATLAMYLCALLIVVCIAVLTSMRLSSRIKTRLLGYEPDAFSAMFKIRDNILESLEEGILAIDSGRRIVFINRAAAEMLRIADANPAGKPLRQVYPASTLDQVLITGEKEFNVEMKSLLQADIISDRMPIYEGDRIVGAVGIYRNRTEYTRLMEDLTGVRYMVESMRASNHDFTNKLHVILGLLQMGEAQQASDYIMNVTMVEREAIHNIMQSIDEPSVAALLIGKQARASELNIRFVLKSGSMLSREAVWMPSGDLVTIIGNLLDNAMDSLNGRNGSPRELTVGVFGTQQAMLISVDDTGDGIAPENIGRIFENGFSTKGTGRGSGLYLVRNLVQTYGGAISVESEPGMGTSFVVSFQRDAMDAAGLTGGNTADSGTGTATGEREAHV